MHDRFQHTQSLVTNSNNNRWNDICRFADHNHIGFVLQTRKSVCYGFLLPISRSDSNDSLDNWAAHDIELSEMSIPCFM